jgi:Pyruvate/2-oxoacid:ferredoxin oxidoreductase delta subunit
MTDAAYVQIAAALDQGPLTAPKAGAEFSPPFIGLLKLLFSEEEADLVRHLGMSRKRAKTADEVAELSDRTSDEVRAVLEPLFARGLVIGLDGRYSLPTIPTFLNYHQHRTELGPNDIEAAKLYKEFFVKGGFYRYYEGSERGTQVARVIPVRRSIKYEEKVLDIEEAHQVIDAVEHLRLVPCPCRTRAEKLGERRCVDHNPVGFCITMGSSALYFEHLGWGRKVTAAEAKSYFDEMQEHGLVGTTDNFVHFDHSVICLCCGCCCSQIGGRTLWDNPDAVAPANFVAGSNDDCVMCGECEERCPFGAISMDEELGRSSVAADTCMGCGVCTYVCPNEALSLSRVDRHEPLADARELYTRIWLENHERPPESR